MRKSLQIADLIDEHEGDYLKCKGCHLCSRIRELAKAIPPAKKFERILQKGRDMTKSDIALLLENEVQRKKIRQALDMSAGDFLEMMKNFGFNKRRVKDLVMPVEEYKVLKAQGLTDKQIAQRKNIDDVTLRNWKYKNGIKGRVKKAVVNKSSEVAELKKKVKELETKLEEYENINAACDDVESEIASLREAKEDIMKQFLETRHELHQKDYRLENLTKELEKIQHQNSVFEQENQALRQLVKLWIEA